MNSSAWASLDLLALAKTIGVGCSQKRYRSHALPHASRCGSFITCLPDDDAFIFASNPNGVQPRDGLNSAHQIRIFLPNIEEVGFVRPLGTVADAIHNDDRAEVVADGVHNTCTDAAARRAAGDEQRIYASVDQVGRKVRAKEGGRLSLPNHVFAWSRLQFLYHTARGGRFRKEFEARRLLAPDPGIRAIFSIHNPREDDWNARSARSGEQRNRIAGSDSDIAATEVLWIEKPVHEIDEE